MLRGGRLSSRSLQRLLADQELGGYVMGALRLLQAAMHWWPRVLHCCWASSRYIVAVSSAVLQLLHLQLCCTCISLAAHAPAVPLQRCRAGMAAATAGFERPQDDKDGPALRPGQHEAMSAQQALAVEQLQGDRARPPQQRSHWQQRAMRLPLHAPAL
jgi:hypothetical protein